MDGDSACYGEKGLNSVNKLCRLFAQQQASFSLSDDRGIRALDSTAQDVLQRLLLVKRPLEE